MPTHHFPSLPVGVMQMIVRWRPRSPTGFYGCQRTIFSFINQNPYPPGWVPITDPVFTMTPWLNNAFLGTAPFDTTCPEYYWFINTPAGYFHQFNPLVVPSGTNDYCASPALCVSYSKFALPASRNLTGRMALMPIPKNFFDQGALSSAALGLYAARQTNLMAPITWDGIIYAPAIFSNQLGTYTTLDRIVLNTRPSYVYRRRPGQDRIATPWVYVP